MIDGAMQGFDMSFHDAQDYTSPLVFVNKPACVTYNKAACRVTAMGSKSAPSVKKQPRRRAEPSYDGETLGQRLRKAMQENAPEMREKDVLAACRELTKVGGQPVEPPIVSQQLLNQILNDQITTSKVVPVVAEACGVRATWLQFGLGPMRAKTIGGRGAMTNRDHADKAFMELYRDLPEEWAFSVRSIVEALGIVQRESHGEFARKARAETRKLLAENGLPTEMFDRET